MAVAAGGHGGDNDTAQRHGDAARKGLVPRRQAPNAVGSSDGRAVRGGRGRVCAVRSGRGEVRRSRSAVGCGAAGFARVAAGLRGLRSALLLGCVIGN